MKMVYHSNHYEMLKRIRKLSFLTLTSFAVLCAWLMVPNQKLPVTSIVVDPGYFSQISDASWIPMAAAICAGIFLPFIGVLYCKNTLTEDLNCGVFSLVRISPTNSFSFVVGKFFANLEIMISMLVVIMLGSYVMICAMFSSDSITACAFFTPFAAVVPGVIFASSIAILLDCFSLSFPKNGNFIGLLLFLALYLYTLTISVTEIGNHSVLFDITGLQWMIDSINQITWPVTKTAADITILAGGDAIRNSADLPALVFQGILPSKQFFCQKIILCLFSILLVYISSLILPGYMPGILAAPTHPKKSKLQRKNRKKDRVKYTKPVKKPYPNCFQMQISLYFLQLSSIWWIGLTGLLCISFFAPLKIAEDTLVPILFGWSFLLFSQLGCLEYTHNMLSQTLCIPNAYIRQLFQGLLCGILFSVIITLPIIIRCFFVGEFSGLAAILAFDVFIPSFTLLLGELSHNSRPSEIMVLVLCFLMLNQPSIIIGISPEYVTPDRTIMLYCLSAAFITAAALKRKLKSR